MHMNIKDIAQLLSMEQVNPKNSKYVNIVREMFKESVPRYYEQEWLHIVVYNSIDKEVFYCNNEFIECFVFFESEKNQLTFFSPLIKNDSKFLETYKVIINTNEHLKVKVQSVDLQWIGKNTLFLNKLRTVILPRSLNEVIYSTKLLHELYGNDFSKLRATKNKFRNELSYFEVNDDNVEDVILVLKQWQKVQGSKYEKNKFAKERDLIKFLSLNKVNDHIEFKVVRYRNNFLGYYILIKPLSSSQNGVIYVLKGLNRTQDGGVHGLTDAVYLEVFRKCFERGIMYINDGDLGSEEGTINHKLRFKPVDRYQYFDLAIY